MVPVHRGKGAKDRCVPLPESTLQSLRCHWVTCRHPRFILRALGRGPNWACPRPALHPRRAWQALPRPSFQGAFRQAKCEVQHRLCLDSYT
jgi:hypothetical protein